MVGGAGSILVDGVWWWVVVGSFWVVVGGSRFTLDGGGWWWMVVGGDTVYNNSLIFEKEGSKQNLFDSHKIIFLHLPIMIV